MDERVRQQLIELNRKFYGEFAESFAETRRSPQPGFYELENHLPQSRARLLDVGCGEGRLGRHLLSRGVVNNYHGVDSSRELIRIARREIEGQFWCRDIATPGALDDLGRYECIACLAVLQHIPGRDHRVRLMAEMGAHLATHGVLLLSTWQFLTSERQRKKIVDWAKVGLTGDDVEHDDYVLTWRKGGLGLRYVCYIDEAELRALARAAGLGLLSTFRSDGREGNLNLYAVMCAQQPATSLS